MPYEKELAQAWREGWWLGNELTTTEGHGFKVIYPGYSGLSWGPDFRRAAILQHGKRVKGDIEFHVRSRDWVEHGHHRDLAYNQVILHVVFEDNLRGPTLTSTGGKVPVFIAGGFLQNTMPVRFLPCRNPALTSRPELLRNILARQGELWFLEKALHIYRAFESVAPEEALYRGIFQAMGYSENKVPYFNLACLLPFRAVQKWASGLEKEERLACVQKLYLALSGLYPEESFLSEMLLPEPLPAGAAGTGLKRSDWKFQGLRPANHPARRLRAASSLIARYLDKGLINGLVRIIGNLKSGEPYPHKCLMVENTGECANLSWKVAFLGRGRAQLILVNVILPFAHALGKNEENSLLRRRALALFRHFPSTGDNIILRHFRRLFGQRLKLDARQEQGLLRMEKVFCSQGKCGRCPLSRRLKPPVEVVGC